MEALVAGVADEEVVSVGRLPADHALLALQAEPRFGPDPLHEVQRVLETRRVSAVAALVARDELLGLPVAVLLGRAEAETAHGARRRAGWRERVGSHDGDLEEAPVALEPALLYLLTHRRLQLFRELGTRHEVAVGADVVLYILEGASTQVDREDGLPYHPVKVRRVQHASGDGEIVRVTVRGHALVYQLNNASSLDGFV